MIIRLWSGVHAPLVLGRCDVRNPEQFFAIQQVARSCAGLKTCVPPGSCPAVVREPPVSLPKGPRPHQSEAIPNSCGLSSRENKKGAGIVPAPSCVLPFETLFILL